MPAQKKSKKSTNGGKKALKPGECKDQILLRKVPCDVIQAINRKKTEILTNNPYRTTVSNSEAIYKIIQKG